MASCDQLREEKNDEAHVATAQATCLGLFWFNEAHSKNQPKTHLEHSFFDPNLSSPKKMQSDKAHFCQLLSLSLSPNKT